MVEWSKCSVWFTNGRMVQMASLVYYGRMDQISSLVYLLLKSPNVQVVSLMVEWSKCSVWFTNGRMAQMSSLVY